MSSKAAQSYSSYEKEEKPQLVYAPYYDAYMGVRCTEKTGMLCPNGWGCKQNLPCPHVHSKTRVAYSGPKYVPTATQKRVGAADLELNA